MGDVEHEIAATVIIVADEGGTCWYAFHNLDQTHVDAVRDQPVEDHLSEGIVTNRTHKDASSVRPRGLIDEYA